MIISSCFSLIRFEQTVEAIIVLTLLTMLFHHRKLMYVVLLFPTLLWLNRAKGQAPGPSAQNTAAQSAPTPDPKAAGGGTVQVSTPQFPVISLNLDLKTFSDYLPFDVDFKIAGGSSTDLLKLSEIIKIDCYYIDKGGQQIPANYDFKNWKDVPWVNPQTSNQYTFLIKALEPNKHFTFVFRYQRVLSTTEKTKLNTLIQAIIQPTILGKAINNDLAFTDQQITDVITIIKNKIQEALRQDGVTTQIDNILPAQSANLFTSTRKIIEAYKITDDELRDLNLTFDDLRNLDVRLTQFRSGYRNTSHSPDKAINLDAMNAVHRAIGPLFNYPTGANAIDPAQLKTYSDKIAAVAASFDKVKLPNDAEFKRIETLINNQVISIGYKLGKYSADLQTQQTTTTDQLDAFTNALANTLFSYISIYGTNIKGDFKTRSNTYVSADIGISVLPRIARITPYIGTNIYFRPVNPDAPLLTKDDPFVGDKKRGFSDFVGKRLSLDIGVSVATLARPYVRSDLFSGSFNLVTGLGFRITDWVRINGGFVWYSALDNNPLNTNTHIAATPFVSLSFDLRIKTALNSLFASSTFTSVSP